ncbi:MBL fold metallo-hydrolase [Spirosoma litoris]
MKLEQIYTDCLAEVTYFIESEGEVAIVDPLRETKPYIDRANAAGATIKYVFETHFHADFVSGHIDLASKTGATIIFGPTAQPSYAAYIAKDGEEFSLGRVKIKVLHTPGHTLESSSFLLMDETGKAVAIFTGDTLFIGDVGRPDLAVRNDLTREVLAGYLYDSLHNKILTLPDEVLIYPGHGAGSACGKNMSRETVDTIGNQKKINYALRAPTKEAFIREVIRDLLPPPPYFLTDAVLNKTGYPSVDEVVCKGTQALSPAAFALEADEEKALILDVRPAEEFGKGFIPNAINIGLDGQFAGWAGTLLPDLKQPILLVAPEGRAEEAVLRLARVGFDNCIGYLNGGFAAWQATHREVNTIPSISADAFADLVEHNSSLSVIDVRRKSEYDVDHVAGAENLPLESIRTSLSHPDSDKTYYVYCAGGYRSMIALSLLSPLGFTNLFTIAGGFTALKKTNRIPITANRRLEPLL